MRASFMHVASGAIETLNCTFTLSLSLSSRPCVCWRRRRTRHTSATDPPSCNQAVSVNSVPRSRTQFNFCLQTIASVSIGPLAPRARCARAIFPSFGAVRRRLPQHTPSSFVRAVVSPAAFQSAHETERPPYVPRSGCVCSPRVLVARYIATADLLF